MNPKVALATIVDSRIDFFAKREKLVEEEIRSLDWLRNVFDVVESKPINTNDEINNFACLVKTFNPDALIIHIPIWADPILAIKIYNKIQLPVLLLGNSLPGTSSLVGMLGAGGALDQSGVSHIRIFDDKNEDERRMVLAFIKAANAVNQLKGQTLGRFGGSSLGIVTADIDPSQWSRQFGVNVEYIDQFEIIKESENIDSDDVIKHIEWLNNSIGKIEYNKVFSIKSLEKQVRSYLATCKLLKKYNLDFVAVKCQPELSDGYVSQCLAHSLMNGSTGIGGIKKGTVVHACESDADGALTMQILKLLSNSSSALLDVRWYNKDNNLWTFANCGAIPFDFFASIEDPTGLSNIKMVPHVFGKGGAGALTGVVPPQNITIARLCRRNGEYWMAILSGEVVEVSENELSRTTYEFPKAFIRTPAGFDFLNIFGSNHVHMVKGDFTDELVMFCKIKKMEYVIWK